MTRPGFPPKPTALKLLEGNPGKRPLNQREPKPLSEAPTPPNWMDREAKAEWRRMIPQLKACGLLARIDRGSLTWLCVTWSQAVALYLNLEEFGRTFTTASGYIMPRPEVRQYIETLVQYRQYCHDFGLSPSARSRIEVSPPAERDALEDLLRG